jgi:hypothetical protein
VRQTNDDTDRVLSHPTQKRGPQRGPAPTRMLHIELGLVVAISYLGAGAVGALASAAPPASIVAARLAVDGGADPALANSVQLSISRLN